MYDYDEIDRALFALPLEEAPAGLRESILDVTVRAPRPRVSMVPIGVWEGVALGIALAAMAWLTLEILTNASFTHQTSAVLVAIARTMAAPATLWWLGIGAAAAFWFSFPTFRPARIPARSRPA